MPSPADPAADLLNAYLLQLKKWSDYYTPARKNTPTELKLWRALHRALDRLSPYLHLSAPRQA